MVGNTECPHLAGGFQFIKCGSHLFRFHQCIGPMQEEDIKIIRLKAGQDAFHGFDDMFLREIIVALAYAAFGLNDQIFPSDRGVPRKGFPEYPFTLSLSVDIRMVIPAETAVGCRMDEPRHFFRGLARKPHTADDDG